MTLPFKLSLKIRNSSRRDVRKLRLSCSTGGELLRVSKPRSLRATQHDCNSLRTHVCKLLHHRRASVLNANHANSLPVAWKPLPHHPSASAGLPGINPSSPIRGIDPLAPLSPLLALVNQPMALAPLVPFFSPLQLFGVTAASSILKTLVLSFHLLEQGRERTCLCAPPTPATRWPRGSPRTK